MVQKLHNTGDIKDSSSANRETTLDTKTGKIITRGNHPNSLKNLNPFPKGISGNPSGRNSSDEKLAKALKKKADVPIVYKNWIEKDKEKENDKRTHKERVIDTIWREAIMGNIHYVQLLGRLGCLDE